jgi:glycolate oxidase FAD binding subunit
LKMMTHTIDLEEIAESLGALCGPEHIRAVDGRLAVAPADTEQVAAVLRYANENGIAISARGGGTKQSWGQAGDFSLTLETARMNSVREHPWQDMTCTVEAGCSWSQMQAVLAAHGQFVALDPLWPGRATVGGVVATNDSGCFRLRYGSLRDLIIGMTIVLADGTIARSGGKVVKNVAGYDLHKLMTGAFGTLGIMTEVTFRLHSIPKHTRSLTVSSADVDVLGKLLLSVRETHLCTQSLQVRSSSNQFLLDLRLAGIEDVLHDHAAAFAALAEGLGLAADDAAPDVWDARECLFGQPEDFVVKATMLPTNIAGIAKAVENMGGRSVTQATGIMTAGIPGFESARLCELRDKIEAAAGSVTILQQPPESTLNRWGTAPDTLPLMREIKHRFDANRILNPGRFLGGI